MEEKKEFPGRRLVDLVFSWSIEDVLNEYHLKSQVRKIPLTFSSTNEYMNSFYIPLLEETRADLSSSMSTLSRAPTRRIFSLKKLKDRKGPEDFFYRVTLEREFMPKIGTYQPVVGDLIALTNVRRPQCINDLDKSYVIAFVQCAERNYGICYTHHIILKAHLF
ncbi:hypothetical protein SLA2020_339450 [Shorea laevis]